MELENKDQEKEQLRIQLRKKYKRVYDTEQLMEIYDVIGFSGGCVAVSRKDTGEKGTFQFTHIPRLYFNYVKD